MSYQTTVGAMSASVRLLGDYDPGQDGDGYISAAFILDRLDSAYRDAWVTLATTDPDRLTTTTGTLLGAGTTASFLPSDLYRLRRVERQDGTTSGMYVPLLRDDPSPLRPWATVGVGGPPLRYRLEGGLLFLDPPAQSGTVLRLAYIPAPQTLSSSLQAVDVPGGIDDLVVWETLRDCRVREEKSTAECDTKIVRLERQVLGSTRDRDRGQPRRVPDPVPGGVYSPRRRRWR